ncbi:NADP-dependent oxidoreductase [Nonomuraea sp. NPDC052265]|uniref:NADP-dependent oxidoreductase n=1 Tax=Nonomuraea sp. NPDC052265 TaxID=3364374 RepID=UPI0037C82890
MSRAVRFSRYGGPEVLEIVQVPKPSPGPGQVLVRAIVAPINPGEIGIREGAFADIWPASFPEGQGNDFAGQVVEVGVGVTGFSAGDEVIGYAPRRAQADYVVHDADTLARKPPAVCWEEAAPLSAVGVTAWAGVDAVNPQLGQVVVVSAAAGGVGVLAAQLARLRGATVIGTVGPRNVDFVRSLGIIPVLHGPGLAERIRQVAPSGVDALIDTFGDGHVATAIALGVSPQRINTIADRAAVRRYGVHDRAQEDAFSPRLVERLATMVADKRLLVPISAVYPLEQVGQAYVELAERHTRGKIVLSLVLDADTRARPIEEH